MTAHGYNAYTHGCRCEVCREAKRVYIAEKRERARQAMRRVGGNERMHPGYSRIGVPRYVAPNVTHGTTFAYEEAMCRCWPCTDHKAARERTRTGRAA